MDKTIIISGVGPTRAIFAPLKEHYDVAVYDQANAHHLAMAHGNIDVKCPMNGAQQKLFDNARNDATLAAAEVVKVAHEGLAFSMNGKTPQALSDARRWLPGLALGHLVDLYTNIRVLDVYSENADIVGIITHEDVTPRFRALALWGKARGVPVIHMPHNNCYAQVRPDIHDNSVADWILAASPYMRDWYAERGFPKSRIKIVGFPAWDEWAGIKFDQKTARAMLQIGADETVITLCTGWPQRTNYVDDWSMTEAMVHLMFDVARDEGYRLIWKIHPGDVSGNEAHGAKVAAGYRIPVIVMRDQLAYALKAADLVISTGPSNVLVEAGIADVPPALFKLRGYGFDRTPPWVIEPTKQGVKEMVARLILGDEWQKKRAAFIQRYAFRDDGKSAERAVRQIRKIING